MKLIIDIPEELYTYMQSESYDAHLDRRFDYQIRFAVRDATPLPKGHGRLIDADRLIKEERIDLYTNYGVESKVSAISIEMSPTVIEADKGVIE